MAAPNRKPKTVPPIEMTRARFAFGSAFDLAMAARTIPAVPNKIGKNRTAIAPKMIPKVDMVFVLLVPAADSVAWFGACGSLGSAVLSAVFAAVPQLEQKAAPLTDAPQEVQNDIFESPYFYSYYSDGLRVSLVAKPARLIL